MRCRALIRWMSIIGAAAPFVLGFSGCGSPEQRPAAVAPPRVELGVPSGEGIIRVATPSTPDPEPSPLVLNLLERHNQERQRKGLSPLELDPALCASAQEQVQGMVRMGRLTHKGADGSNLSKRVLRQGYPYQRIGENVALGQTTVDDVVDDWMKSRGHRDNILGDFQAMGAARAQDDRGRTYWCVNFGTPRTTPRLSQDERRMTEDFLLGR